MSTQNKITGDNTLHPDDAKPSQVQSNKTRKVLRKKVKTPLPIKKYAWLAGHGSTLCFGFIFTIFYFGKFLRFFKTWYWIPTISYILAFVGVISAYSITIITTFGNVIPGYQTLLATENFQNLILAFIWIISRQSIFKLIPYYVVSILQIANFYNVNAILKFDRELSGAIAFSEFYVIFALLFDTLLFRGASGFALAIYVSFYWVRINFSPYTQSYLLSVIRRIDEKAIKNQKPEIKAKWQKVKDFLEFRRSIIKETLDQKLDNEVQPKAKIDRSTIEGRPLGDKTESYQIQGQTDISAKELSKGIFIPDDYNIKGEQLRSNPIPAKKEAAVKANSTSTVDENSAGNEVVNPTSGKISSPSEPITTEKTVIQKQSNNTSTIPTKSDESSADEKVIKRLAEIQRRAEADIQN
ncbi:hypothetical protein WICMUC_003679 [Wickerhamomyces mucosus]|uniref:Transmembrane protein n=1 Tax=Wickerhamomyces mucosus TaxID=1378264 RepID=A0A9P8PLH0_9ASCO|nr:hypothetical protein WICMUC_003679 [Wickerhamomyces mucosus]